jgi:hypothetical protein
MRASSRLGGAFGAERGRRRSTLGRSAQAVRGNSTFPTVAVGNQVTPYGCAPGNEVTVANINDDCHWPSMDKMGQYFSLNESGERDRLNVGRVLPRLKP